MADVKYKAVITTWLDTTEPADGMQITPHFVDNGATSDPDQLAQDLCTAFGNWLNVTHRAAQRRVTLYDDEGTPPVYPAAIFEANTGVVVAAGQNRDLAVCLSFYAGENRPRRRGRLYVPVVLTGMTATGANVPSGMQTKVSDLVPIFASLGGVDVDWVVRSGADNASRKVTNWWVDNSYDTQRRRGKRATGRVSGTTSG